LVINQLLLVAQLVVGMQLAYYYYYATRGGSLDYLIYVCNGEMNNEAVGEGARMGFQSFCQYMPCAFCCLVAYKALVELVVRVLLSSSCGRQAFCLHGGTK
jgi:hypothetical protein